MFMKSRHKIPPSCLPIMYPVLVLLYMYEVSKYQTICLSRAVADPGFPVGGGVDLIRGAVDPPRQLRFKNFACQNERIWTRRGGARAGRAPPLDPPMSRLLS